MGAEEKKEIDKQRDKENKLIGLYDEYFNRIAHYIYVRLGDKSEAEDLASEVFMKALESLKSYEERGIPMHAWLYRIARNISVDLLRKKGATVIVHIDDIPLVAGEDPVASTEQSIELEKVKDAMKKLTSEQREVVQLRFFSGLSSKETGIILKKRDGAVREMQRAAVEKLRGILTSEC